MTETSRPTVDWKVGQANLQLKLAKEHRLSLRTDQQAAAIIEQGKIYVEVVGYWSPEYLQERRRRLQQFTAKQNANERCLMFPKQSRRSKEEALLSLGLPMIVFDKKSSAAQWISAVYS